MANILFRDIIYQLWKQEGACRAVMSVLTPYPINPLGSFLGLVLCLLPLPPLLKKWNSGVWSYALWVAGLNLVSFVNYTIWYDNVKIVVPVWCDIGGS